VTDIRTCTLNTTGIVWLCLFGTIITYGVFHYYLESLERNIAGEPDKDEAYKLTLGNSVIQAFLDFVGYDSQNQPGRTLLHAFIWVTISMSISSLPIVVCCVHICFLVASFLSFLGYWATKTFRIGYAFVLMIIVATYTANLASFLISSASVKLTVANINDANTRSASTCVIGSSQVIINLLKASYPGVGLRIIKGTDVANVLTMVGAGQCDCAVVYQSDWDNYRNNGIINPGCGMIPVGGQLTVQMRFLA
jgi:hypothetical protein